jgi:hypothetical protein
MPKHQTALSFALVVAAALLSGPSMAQQPATPEPSENLCGQYECVEARALTPAEARASRSHPEYPQPQEIAATKPASGDRADDGNRAAILPP